MFLHAGVVHLLANMFGLLFIGIRLEKEFGFQSGVSTVSVDASSALFGLLGAMLSELLTNWSIYANKCAALIDHCWPKFGCWISTSSGQFSSHRRVVGRIFPRFHSFNAPSILIRKSKYKWYQYFFLIMSVIILLLGYACGLAKLYIEKSPENFPLPRELSTMKGSNSTASSSSLHVQTKNLPF
ncbi:hypothetical protein AAZX31_13G345300 [Glycine max]